MWLHPVVQGDKGEVLRRLHVYVLWSIQAMKPSVMLTFSLRLFPKIHYLLKHFEPLRKKNRNLVLFRHFKNHWFKVACLRWIHIMSAFNGGNSY